MLPAQLLDTCLTNWVLDKMPQAIVSTAVLPKPGVQLSSPWYRTESECTDLVLYGSDRVSLLSQVPLA